MMALRWKGWQEATAYVVVHVPCSMTLLEVRRGYIMTPLPASPRRGARLWGLAMTISSIPVPSREGSGERGLISTPWNDCQSIYTLPHSTGGFVFCSRPGWQPRWHWRMHCPMWTSWKSCPFPTSSPASSLHHPHCSTRYVLSGSGVHCLQRWPPHDGFSLPFSQISTLILKTEMHLSLGLQDTLNKQLSILAW